jgi:hypothetical protein
VKAVRKGYRDIPKAFEIFTADQTYTFKAKGHQNIEQWVQCLHIAVAQAHKGDNSKKGTGKAELSPPRQQENLAMAKKGTGRAELGPPRQQENLAMAKKGTGKSELGPPRQENVVIERPRSVMDTKL